MSEKSLQDIRHNLIDRYRRGSTWRNRWIGPSLLEKLLRWDAAISSRFPAAAHDHLVLILQEDGVITSPKQNAKDMVRYMLRDFYVEPLKVSRP